MIPILLQVFLIAMLPVLELRGAVPIGIGQGANPFLVAVAAVIGNLFPIPFLVVYTRPVFAWIRRRLPKLESFIVRLEERAHLKSRLVDKYGFWGICLLVAIPLPGTGAWTGALVAAMLNMRLKRAFPAIVLGVIVACIIVSISSLGIIGSKT